jgi:glycosyltransferase involved in cell wall biosynthesis
LSGERIGDYRAEIERVVPLEVRRGRFEELYREQEWDAKVIRSDDGSGRMVIEFKSVREVYQEVGSVEQSNMVKETKKTPKFSDLVCGKYKTYPNLTGKRQAEGGLRLSGNFKNSNGLEPLVSIITVVYNNSTTFERCISSVVNQKYCNIEYIIIDGGSDQATIDIIHKYSDKIDYFVSEPDRGIYNAMNKGLELASGDYISILNSDDWYSPDFVSLCVEKALRKGASIVHTYCRHGENEWITPGVNEGIALGHLNIYHGSFLVSQECYNKVGKYSENYRIVSDVLWIRKAFFSGAKFDLIQECLFNFSEGGLSSGSTEKRKELMISEIIKITQEQFKFLEEKEAEDLYIFRFDKNRVSKIISIVDKYAHKSIFLRSLSKYIDYCFKYRDNFKLEYKESNKLFPKFITVSDKLSIPKSSIRINTKYGCFSKLIKSIDAIASKKKQTQGKVIIHYVFNFSTASETFIYDLICRLEENTVFDNYVLYDHRILEKERPYEKGLHVHWVAFRKEVVDELYKHIFAQINPDVVIAHFASNEWKLFQRIKPLGISVPTISMTHGIDVFSMRTNQEYKTYLVNDFSRRGNTSFTTVSNYLQNALESHGIPKDKITLAHNTIHERFFLNRKTSNSFKKDGTLNLLAIGRLIEWKGHVYLLQGLKHFIDNYYANVHLTIVYGQGTEYYEQTVAEIKKLSLTSRVSLIPFIDFSAKPDFFHSFDIFIQPSIYSNNSLNRSESFGMAVLEAIAAGLPVIVTDAGGLPEVVGYSNKFAKIVPHGDGIAIARALQEFLEKGECFHSNSEYARERLSCFSSKKQIFLLTKEIIKVSQSKLNVHLFSSSTLGGAGYAAFRLHRGLLETSINSTMLTTIENHKSFPNVRVIQNPVKDGKAWRVLQDKSISKEGLTIFTLNHPFLTATQLESMVKDADVINLHWTARFLSIENIAQLSNIGKPLVITIRDMFPLTGGCHFFHGCSEWQKNCRNCQQLVDTFDDFPSKVLNAKRRYYNFDNITIVTLSKHSAEIVKKVPYFNKCRIEIIPNSIETDVFKPYNKNEARKKLSLPLERKIIGYMPSSSSTLKGYRELIVAFDLLKQQYKNLNPFIMLLGDKTPLDKEVHFENRSLGYINDNQTLALAYSAADLVVVPSWEETFSNTTAESISCGTPVVGFQTGGIPDMVKDGVTGYTSPVGDVEGLATGIHKTLVGKSMSHDCRAYAEKYLSFMIQARRYEELFYELYAYNTVPQLSDSESSLYHFSETTLAVMNLLVSKLLNQ